jgi:hypothetical protein
VPNQRTKPRGGFEPARLPIDSIVRNPRNARIHPEEQLERLTASVRRFGQTRPILVRRANSMLIAGEGTHEACRRAGLAEVDVVLWDCDQATADAYMLGDNRLAQLGRDDAARTRELLREFGFADPESIGYTAVEIEQLLDQAVDDIDVVEIETGPVEDRFWISIRGPLEHQAAALKRLQLAMADLPAVDVELGTVPHG